MREKIPEEEFKKLIEDTQRRLFGERYVGKHLRSIDVPTWAQQRIAEFMKRKKHFLVYCGNPGIGKTHLGAALVEWMLKNFNSFRAYKEADLQRKIRNCMTTEHGDYLQHLKYFIDDDFLMVDDLGRDGINTWREEVLIEIVEERYCSQKPTLFTSNLSSKDFLQKYHERIHSRLFSTENVVVELMNGVDHRMI